MLGAANCATFASNAPGKPSFSPNPFRAHGMRVLTTFRFPTLRQPVEGPDPWKLGRVPTCQSARSSRWQHRRSLEPTHLRRADLEPH